MQKIKDKNMLPMHSMTAWHTLNQLRNKAVDPAKKNNQVTKLFEYYFQIL